MTGLDIDSILSGFEKSKPAAPTSKLDIDAILSDFNTDAKPADIRPTAIKKVVAGEPSAPISDSQYASDEARRAASLPVERPAALTSESAYEHHKSGKEMVSSGIEDIGSGHPYKGAGKVALGALTVAGAPLSGIIDDTVGKVGNKIGPGFGDKAALITGMALPVVPGAGAVVKAIPKNKALSTLVENIGRENLPEVVAAMKANPRLAPADLSPRVLQDTQHLFANEGPQIDYLAKASANRMASSKAAVNDAYDTTAGVSPDLAGKVQGLADAAKKVGEEAIQPAIKGAKPVEISDTLGALDSALKPGINKIGDSTYLTEVKKELNDIRRDLRMAKEYNADDLHWYQAKLRKDAETLIRSGSGSDKARGNAMMEVRNNLVADIDKATNGKYKPALSSYRDEMHIADSFRNGYEGVFSSSKKMENDPSFTKKWFEGLTEHEQQAAREGARARIATEIGTARNPALAGESFARSDFNQEKLATLFGKEEAAKLIKTLQEERTIANTHNKIIEGSQTAMRTASKSQFALPTKTEVMQSAPAVAAAEASNYFMGGVPAMGAAMLGVAKGGAMAKDMIKMKLAREHNARYAQYALPTEGPSRDALIAALEAQIPGPKPSLVTRGASALSRIVAP